jgi:hypothetical protein
MDIANLGQMHDVFRVLEIFAEADAREALYWKFETEGELKMFAMCSDTFEWATADLEEITTESVPVLDQALKDLQKIDGSITHFITELYACRMRQMRPMRAYYRQMRSIYPDAVVDKVFELLNACGPERED